MTPNMTPEEKEQFEKDSTAFFEDYKELVKKHNIDFATFPVLVPDKKGMFMVSTQTSTMRPPKANPESVESPNTFIPN
ncbi:MAG: hypothetical protein WC822_07225 [Candidatus Paceibacterota bacterium]|jgi:hypothetical protein